MSSSGEKQGVRKAIDEMAKRTIEANPGKISRDQAYKMARQAARYVNDGEKYRKD